MSVKVKRASAKGHITRAMIFVEAIDSAVSLEQLQNRLDKIEEAWKSFCTLQDEYPETLDESLHGELNAEFADYESKYFKAHEGLSRAIKDRRQCAQLLDPNETVFERLVNQQSTFLERLGDSRGNTSNVHLPKIVIPPFAGDYKDWPSFRDLFVGSVDSRSNLTPTQKFQYLKSFLRDEAANLVKHIPISETNYIEAWERLEARYDKVNLIVRSFIQSFLSLPSMSVANVQTLRNITDGADEVVRGINALDKTGRDPWLIYLLVSKIDSDSCKAWAEFIGSRDDCTIDSLLEFLQTRCNALESCQPLNRSHTKPTPPLRSHVSETNSAKPKCPKCYDVHSLSQCPKFVSLDILSRREFVKSHLLCFNCLRVGHSANKCRSTFRCRVCKSSHHTLVHLENAPTKQSSSHPCSSTPVSDSLSSANHSNAVNSSAHPSPLVNNVSLEPSRCKQTILPTISATARDIHGNPIVCRVLLDSGSQSSFVVESFAKRLGLPRSHARIPVHGLSSLDAGYTKGRISIQLSSLVTSATIGVDAFVLAKLTSNLPCQSFDTSIWPHLTGLQLADPTFNVSSPIDILLGADKLWCIIRAGQILGDEGSPVAQNTSFGWVVSGEFSNCAQLDIRSFESFHITMDVDFLLRRFWEVEDISPPGPNTAVEDPAEQHFKETFSRSSDGKYVVSLPFKVPDPVFGDTLGSAITRLHSMERRFRSNPDLRQMYIDFMAEYIQLGHMTRIPVAEYRTVPGKQFYLPHHAVVKQDSSTKKIRVVFDGSTKDSHGVSLNSSLLVGPPIQRDLIGVCLRFRQHFAVFTADVVKMFRQIWVDDQHSDFQRVVWRENLDDEISHFRLRTVTYGTAAAPFLSVRVLQQLAEDYQLKYPNASKVIREDVYVDDVMTGSSSSNGLIALKTELMSLLSEAKLQPRKWSSNCMPLLKTLPEEDRNISMFDPERSTGFIKVLGMFWDPVRDQFSYKISSLGFVNPPTKRSLLSEVSRIFDPLGFLAPSVLLFKVLFQELWSSDLNLHWDDPLPSPLSLRWTNYHKELYLFEQLRIPRYAISSPEDFQLHGFCDASSVTYAAVIYSRCKLQNGRHQVNIISAKTKVAPLKPVSIPRLELCGALLLARLFQLVTSALSSKPTKIFAWCDSEVVLHWLSSPPRRWATFVANRTAAILDSVPRNVWQHVASEHNPADCASRGLTPALLISFDMWWNGPSWLSKDSSEWPKPRVKSRGFENLEEKVPKSKVLIASKTNTFLDLLVNKFSSWPRMKRVVAYCYRFGFNCRVGTSNRRKLALSLSEILHAQSIIIKLVQQQAFGDDIRSLNLGLQLSRNSRLIKFSPFVDNEGVLRVEGRIKEAAISFNLKHPILLISSHPISRLIVRDVHQRYLHPGISETFVLVRQLYWILGSRNLIRNIIFHCKPCFIQRRQTSQQLMGDLPSCRVQPSRPFTNSGCDYAGPITIKLSRTRKPKLSKAYIALFICMATKAIHLELVSDLTTDAFLAAFRRFVSRRGKCSNIYSDNGTNFHGARRCLTDMHKYMLSEQHNNIISAALAEEGITWHFSPPSAPHFGGLWEAGVKTVKTHLRRVVGSTVLTFEDLYTVLCQIEAFVNSRPLCCLSDSDLNPLTPSHFLVGEPLTAVPEPNYLSVPTNRLDQYRHIQSMVQGFWKRWHNEYLTSLQERPKWQRHQANIKTGDVVILKEPNLPPTKWVIGRVLEVHPGRDGCVRVATVRTSAGNFIRPVIKLAVLPVS